MSPVETGSSESSLADVAPAGPIVEAAPGSNDFARGVRATPESSGSPRDSARQRIIEEGAIEQRVPIER